MAMERARVRLFRVEKCGYYRRGEKKPACGDLGSTLTAVAEWIKNLQFGETCTFKPHEKDEHDQAYCFNILRHSNTGSYLLTLWNRTAAAKGNAVASVPADATVGSATVQFTPFPKNSIPGYASYYWILPERDVFATISFPGRGSACRPFYRYIKGFLGRFFTAHVVHKQDEDVTHDLAIQGYKVNDETGIEAIRPSFAFSAAQNAKHVEMIRQRRAHIRKIAHREELIPKQAKKKNLIKSMLVGLGIEQPDIATLPYKIKYELTYTPTEEELEAMISSYKSAQGGAMTDEDEWEDVGFMFSEDDKTYWLSASRDQHELDLKITRDDDEVFNAKSLLTALEQSRARLLINLQPK
jgi:hypothetical protein